MKSYALIYSLILFISCTFSTENLFAQEKFKCETIELENGQKWTVVPDMMQYLKNMQEAVAKTDPKNAPNYPALAETLSKNLNLLTSNCTMTGKAHDELHKWLVPFLDLSEKFEKAKSKKKQAKLFAQIQSAFTIFNQNFQ